MVSYVWQQSGTSHTLQYCGVLRKQAGGSYHVLTLDCDDIHADRVHDARLGVRKTEADLPRARVGLAAVVRHFAVSRDGRRRPSEQRRRILRIRVRLLDLGRVS